MIITLKSGLSVVSSINLDYWVLQLPRKLFGYRSGVQANNKFYPFMVLIGKTPRLTCDNSLATFINVEEEELTLEEMT
jgi:hypothetical protein